MRNFFFLCESMGRIADIFGSWFFVYLYTTVISSEKNAYISKNLQHDEATQTILTTPSNVGQIFNLDQELEAYNKRLKSITSELEILESQQFKDKEKWKEFDDKMENLEKKLLEISQTNKQVGENILDCDKDIEKKFEQFFVSYFGNNLSKEEIIRIFQKISIQIKDNTFQNLIYSDNKEHENKPKEVSQSNIGSDDIQKIVFNILKTYDADKTGMVDYALESAGGQIITTRCTQRYNVYTRAFKILGLTLYYESNNPRTVIQGNNIQPGMCWAFQDFPGYLLIKLRSLIYVTGFTLEHAPRSNLPNGEMKSAPRLFNVWGYQTENDLEPAKFGEYEFLDSDDSLQYFPVQNSSIILPYEYIEIRIHSNHGQLEYTCLYRFRVHGRPA